MKTVKNNNYQYKRTESYKELMDYLGVEFSSHRKHFENELSNFLECNGSDVVENKDDIPMTSFKVEMEHDITYEIGVTSIEDEEDVYKYYYWHIDTYSKNLIDSHRYKLLRYLEINDFYLLPNYPFNKSFNEMIYSDKYNEIERLEEYSKNMLENKELIIEENKK